jgi:hypothetical protein
MGKTLSFGLALASCQPLITPIGADLAADSGVHYELGDGPTCPGMPMTIAASLPFTVDSKFAPVGYEGDISSVMQTGDMNGAVCGGRAVTGASGNCYKVVYAVPTVSVGFAGVQWQANAQLMAGGNHYNFGTAPGIVPPAGATEASFYAKGARGGELVSFSVGSSKTAPCTDSVTPPPTVVKLTTSWTLYTIGFGAQTYAGGQIVGFAWTAAVPGVATTFCIDDIIWNSGTDK